jgi:hypothetical protein
VLRRPADHHSIVVSYEIFMNTTASGFNLL